jgi:hypothetical protein
MRRAAPSQERFIRSHYELMRIHNEFDKWLPYYIANQRRETEAYFHNFRYYVGCADPANVMQTISDLTALFDAESRAEIDQMNTLITGNQGALAELVVGEFGETGRLHFYFDVKYPDAPAPAKHIPQVSARQAVAANSSSAASSPVAETMVHANSTSANTTGKSCQSCGVQFTCSEELMEMECSNHCLLRLHRTCFRQHVSQRPKLLRWGDAMCSTSDCGGTVCLVRHMNNHEDLRHVIVDIKPPSPTIPEHGGAPLDVESASDDAPEVVNDSVSVLVPVTTPSPQSQRTIPERHFEQLPRQRQVVPSAAPAAKPTPLFREQKTPAPGSRMHLSEFMKFGSHAEGAVQCHPHPVSQTHIKVTSRPMRHVAVDVNGEGMSAEMIKQIAAFGTRSMPFADDRLVIIMYDTALIAEGVVSNCPSDALQYVDIDGCSQHFRTAFQRNAICSAASSSKVAVKKM